jgi:hypothetical protein
MAKRKITVWRIDSGTTGEVAVDDRTGKIVRADACYHWMIGMKFEVIRQTRSEWKYERRDGGTTEPDR